MAAVKFDVPVAGRIVINILPLLGCIGAEH